MNLREDTPHASRLRLGRRSIDNAVYCVTKVVSGRRTLLASDDANEVLLGSWRYLRQVERIKLFAYCIMPDHVHLVFALMPGESLSKVVQDSCKFTARELNRMLDVQGAFWQKGFHDRRCRSEQEVLGLAEYVEHNPVRAELVDSADNWPYSSASQVNQSELDRDWFRLG